MNKIVEILISRDGYTVKEAIECLKDARKAVATGADPEEILHDDFGLEPDYIFDLIGGAI